MREDEGERVFDEGDGGRVEGVGWSEGDRGGREADDCREREPAILSSAACASSSGETKAW